MSIQCEEKAFFSTHKYLNLDMGKVGSMYKLAVNAICDKVLLNYHVWCYCFMDRHQHLALKRDPIANVKMDSVDSHEE